MLVRISDRLTSALEEPDDFGRLSVKIDVPANQFARVKEALCLVGRLSDDKNMWVFERWLRTASSRSLDEVWQYKVTGMINAVRKFGWVHEQAGVAVRAHLIWRDIPKS
jgi:hypothetical protein